MTADTMPHVQSRAVSKTKLNPESPAFFPSKSNATTDPSMSDQNEKKTSIAGSSPPKENAESKEPLTVKPSFGHQHELTNFNFNPSDASTSFTNLTNGLGHAPSISSGHIIAFPGASQIAGNTFTKATHPSTSTAVVSKGENTNPSKTAQNSLDIGIENSAEGTSVGGTTCLAPRTCTTTAKSSEDDLNKITADTLPAGSEGSMESLPFVTSTGTSPINAKYSTSMLQLAKKSTNVTSQSDLWTSNEPMGEECGNQAIVASTGVQDQRNTNLDLMSDIVSVPVEAFEAFVEQQLNGLSKNSNTPFQKGARPTGCGSEDLIDLTSVAESPSNNFMQKTRDPATKSAAFLAAASDAFKSFENRDRDSETPGESIENELNIKNSARRSSSNSVASGLVDKANQTYPKPRSVADLQHPSNNPAAFLAAASNVYNSFDMKIYAPESNSGSSQVWSLIESDPRIEEKAKEHSWKDNSNTTLSRPVCLADKTNEPRPNPNSMPMESPNASTSAKDFPCVLEKMNPNGDKAVEIFVIHPNSRGSWYELEMNWIRVSRGGREFYVL